MARRRALSALALAAGSVLTTACSTLDAVGLGATPYERQAAALRAYQSGAEAEAEALYLGLIRMAPNDPEHLLRLGNLYARSGRPDRAADSYTQALLLAPGDGRLWYNLGLVRQRQAHAALIEAHAHLAPDDARRARVETMAACLAPGRDETPLDAPPDAARDATPEAAAGQ